MYPPAAPRPTSNNTLKIVLIVTIVVVVPCVALIVGLTYVFRATQGLLSTQIGPLTSCELRFAQARDALLLYAQDHAGRLPLAANWQDAIEPYVSRTQRKTEEFAGMKIEPLVAGEDWGCKTPEGKSTGMAFNSKLSGKKVSDIEDKRGTILLYEIPEPKRNAAGDYAPLPASTSPTFMGQRRGWAKQPVEGGTGLMEGRDGSVKWDVEAGQSESKEGK